MSSLEMRSQIGSCEVEVAQCGQQQQQQRQRRGRRGRWLFKRIGELVAAVRRRVSSTTGPDPINHDVDTDSALPTSLVVSVTESVIISSPVSCPQSVSSSVAESDTVMQHQVAQSLVRKSVSSSELSSQQLEPPTVKRSLSCSAICLNDITAVTLPSEETIEAKVCDETARLEDISVEVEPNEDEVKVGQSMKMENAMEPEQSEQSLVEESEFAAGGASVYEDLLDAVLESEAGMLDETFELEMSGVSCMESSVCTESKQQSMVSVRREVDSEMNLYREESSEVGLVDTELEETTESDADDEGSELESRIAGLQQCWLLSSAQCRMLRNAASCRPAILCPVPRRLRPAQLLV